MTPPPPLVLLQVMLATLAGGGGGGSRMSTEAVLSLVFSGVVTLATAVYAALTWKLVSETRLLRRAQTDPHVVVWVVPSAWAFGFADLIVKNFGSGPALDVRFEIVEVIPGAADRKILKALNSFGFLKTGFEYMAPDYEHRTFLESIAGRTDDEMKSNIHVKVRYSTPTGQPLQHCYPLDLMQFWNRMRIGHPPAETIATELEQIRKALERLRDRFAPDA